MPTRSRQAYADFEAIIDKPLESRQGTNLGHVSIV